MTDRFAEALKWHEESVGDPAYLDESDRKHYETIRASLTAAAGVPEGWKLVPIEPTADQRIAGQQAVNRMNGKAVFLMDDCEVSYRAMLDTAPTPPPAEKGQPRER